MLAFLANNKWESDERTRRVAIELILKYVKKYKEIKVNIKSALSSKHSNVVLIGSG